MVEDIWTGSEPTAVAPLRELDHAMLRRLEKRILVSLPSSAARRAMISHWLPPLGSTGGVELRTELDYDALAKVSL